MRPDIREFEFDHAGWDREVIALRQLVEQCPLQAQARGRIVVPLHLPLQFLAQFAQVFQTSRLGELVVDRHRRALADFLHINCKDRLLAGEIRGGIILGKGHADSPLLAGGRAEELLFEAWNVPRGSPPHLPAPRHR